MNFINAIKLTIGLLFIRALLKKLFPDFDNTILGSIIFSSGVFYLFIYFTTKKFQIKMKDIYPMSTLISKNIFGITTSIISMYLVAWVVMEGEVLIKEGPLIYFQNNDEIFSWSSRQRLFLTALIISPIFEELFFRGLLLSSLKKEYTTMKAIIFSSLLFGLSHLRFDNTLISTLFYSLGTGAFYGFIFVRTNDIRTAIYSHFLWNLMVYIFPLFMFQTGYSVESLSSFVILSAVLIVISIALAFVSIKYLDISLIRFFRGKN